MATTALFVVLGIRIAYTSAMPHMDSTYVNQAILRLKKIPDDATPKWGKLRKDSLICHLIWALKHSMDRSKQVPIMSNFFTAKIIAPLVLNGIVPIPKNVKLPKSVRNGGATMQEPGDMETLQALLEEYIALVQADELKTAHHPAFGDIGVDGWDKMHVRHFEHHFKQFGV